MQNSNKSNSQYNFKIKLKESKIYHLENDWCVKLFPDKKENLYFIYIEPMFIIKNNLFEKLSISTDTPIYSHPKVIKHNEEF